MTDSPGLVVHVHDVLQRPVLISREAARTLQAPLTAALAANGSPATAIVLDFAGISGVAPSFVDEMIKILEELLAPSPAAQPLRLTITNVPTRLSSKFSAIARGHCLSIEAAPDGSWEFRSSAA